jgi:epoxyqueuosine reductase QueG
LLNNEIENLLYERGALKVGFATKNSLLGGPPSTDITYVMSNAKSAVIFALPLDKEKIRSFLRKELPNGKINHELDNIQINVDAFKMGKEVAQILKKEGYNSEVIFPNFKYRTDVDGWQMKMYPELALRYLAARAGVGSIGWSGNIGIKGYGSTVILGGLVTSVELKPTDPIPSEESFCTHCKLCSKVCAFGMFSKEDLDEITLGGHKFTYANRINVMRCQIVCGGLSGLDKTKKWSTWSPGRFSYPETEDQVRRIFSYALLKAPKRPNSSNYNNGFDISQLADDVKVTDLNTGEDLSKEMLTGVNLTCGNCQLICWGDPKETKQNYEILTSSGCVIEHPDGNIEILTPEQAENQFKKFPTKHKRLYYKEF